MQLRPQGPSFFIFLCCTFYGGGFILRLVSPHGHMVAAKNTQEKNALFPSRHGLEEAQAGIKIAGEILITSDMQMTPPYGRKQRRTKEPLDERGE